MFPGNRDVAELTDWRRKLHRQPELSGEEASTAKEVASLLSETRPDSIVTGIGGHGLAAIYEGRESGPTVLFRAELDALLTECADRLHSALPQARPTATR